MENYYKRSGSYAVIAFITILLSAFSQMPVYATQPMAYKAKHAFQISVNTELDTITLAGESEFMATPSSYSIKMIEDNGTCVIHMLNFNTPPGPGTYNVENTERAKTAAVCVLEGTEPRERLASQSGTFTITEIGDNSVKGHFDMILIGPVSGKKFHLHGEVSSENIPTNLQFGH